MAETTETKKTTLKKSTIVLIVFTVLVAILAAWSIPASVNRVNSEIESLPEKITYTDDCKSTLDAVNAHYQALDENLNLQDQVKGYWKLQDANEEYCRLAIKDAAVADARATADGLSTSDIQGKVTAARAVVNSYLSADEYTNVSNYSTLLSLETKYAPASSGSSETVDVPMC